MQATCPGAAPRCTSTVYSLNADVVKHGYSCRRQCSVDGCLSHGYTTVLTLLHLLQWIGLLVLELLRQFFQYQHCTQSVCGLIESILIIHNDLSSTQALIFVRWIVEDIFHISIKLCREGSLDSVLDNQITTAKSEVYQQVQSSGQTACPFFAFVTIQH